MIHKPVIILLIVMAAIFQEAALVNLFPTLAVPDVLLVFTGLWTARVGFEKTLTRAIGAGLMLDLIYFWPLGLNVIGLVTVSFVVSFLAKRFLVSQKAWKLLFLVILTVVGTISFHLVQHIILTALALSGHQSGVESSAIIGIGIVYKILANLAILFLAYWPVRKIEDFLSIYNQSVISHKR